MNTLKQIWDFFDGRKTYITAIVLAFYGVLKAFGVLDITPDQDLALLALIGAMLGISIKSAINKK